MLNRDLRFGTWKVILKEKPEIIISHEFSSFSLKSLVYKLIMKEKVKWYITTDDSLAILNNSPLYRKIAKKIILPFVDGLITTSDETKIWFQNRYPHLNLNIFALPIMLNEKNYRSELSVAIPISIKYIRKYNLNDKKIALFAGRLTDVKRIYELVKLFLTFDDPNLVLVVVGDGPLKRQITNTLEKSGKKNVILVGRYDGLELTAWYNVASFFILPSSHEPFGAVINEALLAGVYSICSENAGAKCLINEPDNGILFDPYDLIKLKELIAEVSNKFDNINIENLKVKDNLMLLKFDDKYNDFSNFLINN